MAGQAIEKTPMTGQAIEKPKVTGQARTHKMYTKELIEAGKPKPKTPAEMLLRKGIQPTLQRLRVLEVLLARMDHPTAEDIYRELKPKIPTLSKATVYNTLSLLVAKGLVRELSIEERELRYDSVTKDHGHFKCMACGSIHDFDFTFKSLDLRGLDGFVVEDERLFFKGTCLACRARDTEEGARKNP